jgi:hypothetical protein
LILLARPPSTPPREEKDPREALFTKTPSERLVREPIVALDTAIVILDAAIATGEKKKKKPRPKQTTTQALQRSANARNTTKRRRHTHTQKELRLGFGYGFPSGRIYHINGWDCARK